MTKKLTRLGDCFSVHSLFSVRCRSLRRSGVLFNHLSREFSEKTDVFMLAELLFRDVDHQQDSATFVKLTWSVEKHDMSMVVLRIFQEW